MPWQTTINSEEEKRKHQRIVLLPYFLEYINKVPFTEFSMAYFSQFVQPNDKKNQQCLEASFKTNKLNAETSRKLESFFTIEIKYLFITCAIIVYTQNCNKYIDKYTITKQKCPGAVKLWRACLTKFFRFCFIKLYVDC